jgi:hypothetical protein
MTVYETWVPSARAREADVGGLSIRRLKRNPDVDEHCHFKCRRQDGMLSAAGFVATLLDQPPKLCASCAKEWPAVYVSALDESPVESVGRAAA